MRPKHILAAGLLFGLPFAAGPRLEADGLLKRHLHHGDADQSTTVRLPAQNIRIETTSPRVFVNQSAGHHRARGFVSAGPAFLPVSNAPFVATFLPMTVNPGGAQNLASSNALDAVHALERQHLEVARQKAALAAEMNLLDRTAQRVHSNITASGSASFTGQSTSSDDVRKAIEDLSKRISDVERLLIVHDNILKSQSQKKN